MKWNYKILKLDKRKGFSEKCRQCFPQSQNANSYIIRSESKDHLSLTFFSRILIIQSQLRCVRRGSLVRAWMAQESVPGEETKPRALLNHPGAAYSSLNPIRLEARAEKYFNTKVLYIYFLTCTFVVQVLGIRIWMMYALIWEPSIGCSAKHLQVI